jgi:hypothetical protein
MSISPYFEAQTLRPAAWQRPGDGWGNEHWQAVTIVTIKLENLAYNSGLNKRSVDEKRIPVQSPAI